MSDKNVLVNLALKKVYQASGRAIYSAPGKVYAYYLDLWHW